MAQALCKGAAAEPTPFKSVVASTQGHVDGQCYSAITETSALVSHNPINCLPFKNRFISGYQK
jgi:hypothetical protein